MNKYKLIIFDFDGTLADSFGWFADNINKAAHRFNFRKVLPEDHEHLRHFDSRGVMEYLGIPWWKVPFIARYMRRLMSTEVASIALFQEVESLLAELSSKSIQIAIVSSNSQENVVKILGDHARHVKYFECGVSLFGKCSRFQKILKKAGVKHEEVLCIGDEIRDIHAAREARLSSGSVTWGYGNLEALKARSPDHIFLDLEDIARLI